MGSLADKLAYTKQAREEIRAAIVNKGVSCPGTAPFCQFDEYIAQISGGGSSSLNLEGINITTYGSISIKNLICSGFTYGSNYIKPTCSFNPGTSTWEYVLNCYIQRSHQFHRL